MDRNLCVPLGCGYELTLRRSRFHPALTVLVGCGTFVVSLLRGKAARIGAASCLPRAARAEG